MLKIRETTVGIGKRHFPIEISYALTLEALVEHKGEAKVLEYANNAWDLEQRAKERNSIIKNALATL